MKIKYLKLKNWLLVSLMSVLGFTACKSSKPAATSDQKESEQSEQIEKKPIKDDRGQAALMYGVPTMSYHVKGQVVNHQGKPVKGIQVVMLNRNMGNTPNNPGEENPEIEDYMKIYADTTKNDGTFDIKAKDFPSEYMRVFVRDVDGPSNGNYQNDVINLEFTRDEIKAESKGWNKGVAEKEGVTIKLKPVR
jgi:putative lipoprotein (rSAM/lipoprotein system)